MLEEGLQGLVLTDREALGAVGKKNVVKGRVIRVKGMVTLKGLGVGDREQCWGK